MQAETKKERLLKEAFKLFHEKGFKGTTIKDIAEQMGFEVANVYNYIDSKQTLLEDSLFRISQAFHEGIDFILASSYTPLEKLKEIIRLHVRMSMDYPYEMALHTDEWRHLKEEKRERFVEERKAYEKKVRSMIEDGMKANEIRSMDAEIATHAVLSAVRWLYAWSTDHAVHFNPIELEKQLTEFIIQGLK